MAGDDESESIPNAELAKAAPTAVMRDPRVHEIKDAMQRVIEAIGRSRLIMGSGESSGWWECFSHGLSMAINDGPMGRFSDVAGYLQAESDYLNLDDEGFKRKFEGGVSHEREPMSSNQLKSLALRVAAFTEMRKELNSQGFPLPENPDLEAATILVKSELARDVRTRSSWEQLSGGERLPRELTDGKKEL